MLTRIICLVVAGAAGTLARYGLSDLVHRNIGQGSHWGTFAVNMVGCFCAGAFWAFSESRIQLSHDLKIAILVGFMGAFTTFSAFMLDTGRLMRNAQYFHAFGNLALQNVLGMTGLFLGFSAGKLL